MVEKKTLDLTVPEENEWLAQTRETRSITPTEEDLSILHDTMQEILSNALASALSDYPVGMYFDKSNLEEIATVLVTRFAKYGRVLSIYEQHFAAEQGRSYKELRQALPSIVLEILQEQAADIENLMGVPPEKELERHSIVTADDLFLTNSRLPMDSLPLSIVKGPEQREELGRKAIKKTLSPDKWTKLVRQQIITTIHESRNLNQNFREQRAQSVSNRVRNEANPEIIIRIFLETLGQSERAQFAESLQEFIRQVEFETEPSSATTETLISEFIGYPTSAAADAHYDETAHSKARADRDPLPSRYRSTELESFKPIESRSETGKYLFLLTARGKNRARVFESSVIDGVNKSTVKEFTDVDTNVTHLSAWTLAARGPPKIAAENMVPGDIALFYTKQGFYTHRATIFAVRMAPYVAAEISSDYDYRQNKQLDPRDVRRPIVVFLTNVQPIQIPSQKLHTVLGYQRDYPTWNMVSIDRLDPVKNVYGDIESLLEILNQDSD